MPISLNHLPVELHYIVPLAERHGSDARVCEFDRRLGRHVKYSERLSPRDVSELSQLYSEIGAKNHGPLINSWHRDQERLGSCPADTTWPIFGLLCLFSDLAESGIAPFSDGRVCPEEDDELESLDWGKLPPQLSYLAEPAGKYAHLQFDDAMMEFLQNRMTGEERAELHSLRERIRQDRERLDRWFDEFSEHREASVIYSLEMLLDMEDGFGVP